MVVKQCYNSDGTPSNDLPCDPNADVSACCGPAAVCVNNLYCNIATGNVPGTCTAQHWGVEPNSACPCRAVPDPYDFVDYRYGVTFCELGNLNGPYCCGANNGACCNGGNASSLIVYGNAVRIPANAFTTANTLSASVAAVQTSYYSQLRVTTITGSVSRASSAATSLTSPSASGNNTTTTSLDRGWSSGAKAGLGVGIAIGVVGIVAALAMFLTMRRRQRATKAAHYAYHQSRQGDGRPYERVEMSMTPQHELHGSHPPASELEGVR